MIRVNNLVREYQASQVRTRALSEVSLDVEPGEYVAIMGPSACGKSTLLGVLGLMDPEFSGSYLLDGTEMAFAAPAVKQKARNSLLGYVFQSFNLIGDITVEENILLPRQFSSGGISAADRKRCARLAERFGIASRLNHLPSQMSGGQQQRAAIARALIAEPRVLLADEPTGNLDSETSQQIMQLFDEIHADGTTVIVVTHDEQVAAHATRRIHLADGRVVSDVRTANPRREYA
jgi:putative ABC transport system ATP-binding protein